MAIDQGQLKRVFEEAQGPLGVKEIMRVAGLHPGQQTDLKRVLRDMLKAGVLEKTGKRFHIAGGRGRGKISAKEAEGARKAGREAQRQPRRQRQEEDEGPTVEGVLHVHPDGFGFVHPLTGDGENIFLPPQEARKALDYDVVLVRVVAGQGGRSAGEVIKVVERRREFVVGIYTSQGDRAVVMPKDASLQGPIHVLPTQIARDGDVVKVRLGVGEGLLKGHGGLFGEVAGSLGMPGTPGAEVLNIAFGAAFSDEFPPETMDEADAIELVVTDEEATGEDRRDLRKMPLMTVDGEDARDFDDAIYCEPMGSGWRLVVAIADVSHYVTERTALDAEALHRATSVYLPDRVLPMLPERLSNGICSLKPNEDRLCMVSEMELSADGELQSYELYPGVMRSHARCTYNEVQDVLDGKDVPHRNAFKPQFEKLQALARTLRKMRERRGAIDFDLPEVKVELGPDGYPTRMVQRSRLEAHRIVEECMLAANEAVAKFFQDNELPSVYRYHGDPDEEKLAAFAAVANAHGFELDPEKVTSGELNAFVKQLEGHPEQRALNQLLLRSMMQAIYSSQNVGHYGLAAEHYLHFTSPIRRYPDLLVHRLLKEIWGSSNKKSEHDLEAQEERLEHLAVHCSERERAAMQVEREVVNYYAALLMKDRVGEEFEATVVSVTDFGVFIQLEKELVEGLIRSESIGISGDYDAVQHALVFSDGRKISVGQKLRARLIMANVDTRKLEFTVVSFEGEDVLPERDRSLDSTLEKYRRQSGGGRRPQQPRGRDVRHERREAPPQTFQRQEPKEEHTDGGSPHPGFDRLRALAARKGTGGFGGDRPAGPGERSGGKHGDRSERGGRSDRSERGGGFGDRSERGSRVGGGKPARDKWGNPLGDRAERPSRGAEVSEKKSHGSRDGASASRTHGKRSHQGGGGGKSSGGGGRAGGGKPGGKSGGGRRGRR
ncbi:MAG: ribonuclease R [Myxococcaceae bacterium]